MRHPALASLAAIALAACNQGPSVTATNASVAEVASKVEKATAGETFVSPGQWQGTVTIADISLPGIDNPGAAAAMKKSLGKPQTFTSCLTPEEARQPQGRFFGEQSDQCRYDHFKMAGGQIDAVMTCDAGGTRHTTTMKGSYTPDSYRMTVTSAGKASPANPMGAMTMTMTAEGKRAGACPAKTPA